MQSGMAGNAEGRGRGISGGLRFRSCSSPYWVVGGSYYRWHQQGKCLDREDNIVSSAILSTKQVMVVFTDMKTALSVSLRQSPFLNVLPDGGSSEDLARDGTASTNPRPRWPAVKPPSGQAARPTLADRLGVWQRICWIEGGELPEAGRHARGETRRAFKERVLDAGRRRHPSRGA